jgi:hypothetical protein
MIDDPVEVDILIGKLECHLPIVARGTGALVRFLRGSEVSLPKSRRVQIVRVFYLGDEGGIACDVTLPGSDSALVVSLTHLRLDGGHALSKDVRAYQSKRTRALAQSQ